MALTIDFVENLRLSQTPLPTNWEGARDHIGPVQTVTALVDRLSGKTTCATVTMLSGVLFWGAERLEGQTDTSLIREMAESGFAWQFDWRLANANGVKAVTPPDQPIETSASHVIRNQYRRATLGSRQWHSFFQPIMELFHMANVVSFILDGEHKELFEVWLLGVSDRLDDLALAPELDPPETQDFETPEEYNDYCAPRRGRPLPPMVLDMEKDLDGLDLTAEAISNVGRLDPLSNRFLRSPSELIELGVTDSPYGSTT